MRATTAAVLLAALAAPALAFQFDLAAGKAKVRGRPFCVGASPGRGAALANLEGGMRAAVLRGGSRGWAGRRGDRQEVCLERR